MKKTITDWSFVFRGKCYPCKIPATMYGILLEAGEIADPFYRDNEAELTALAEEDCLFETELTVTREEQEKQNLKLCFEGIDTVADIALDGRILAHVENMHRRWELDVKPFLTEGKHRLSVHIFSPLRYMRERQKLHPIPGNAESIEGVAQIRKASYMMGWDWGPELPDMGIWRQVTLEAYDARLHIPCVRQLHENGKVRLQVCVDGEGLHSDDRILVSLRDPDGAEIANLPLPASGNTEITVENPQLWWANGYGEQPLYTLKTVLMHSGVSIDTKELTIGLRTLTVSTEKDRWGNEFCFVLNGEKIFAKGANYIPEDNLLGRRSAARTERLLQQCVDASFNMIRVWGGGFYPDDCFYETCDRMGLIVWQDFMIACGCIWLTDDREENLLAEFRENLMRIRHHACLGLINGNNEVEASMAYGKNPRNTPLLVADYLRMYHRLLPELVAEVAPDLFYWPSSPSSCQYFDGTPSDETRGDCHYWQVWHNWKPYEDYRNHYFRFCSEYGFEAVPDEKTIARFTAPQDRNLFSPVMLAHQKCRAGNGKLMAYLSDYYLYPSRLSGVIYGSQLLQADAIRTAVEHFRRNRGRCMGSLYWQLNDCWPTVSWSSIDSEGRKKALHYAAKRFYAPLLLSAHESGTCVTFNLSNEQLSAFEGRVRLSLRSNRFEVVWEDCFSVSVDRLSSKDLKNIDFTPYLSGREKELFLVYSLLDAEGKQLSCSVQLFVRPKCYRYQKPNIQYSLQPNQNGLALHLQSDAFAHHVRVDFGERDVEISDQYINLTDQKGVDLQLYGVGEEDLLWLADSISFYSVYDIAADYYN